MASLGRWVRRGGVVSAAACRLREKSAPDLHLLAFSPRRASLSQHTHTPDAGEFSNETDNNGHLNTGHKILVAVA
jgi:hypothetical protein